MSDRIRWAPPLRILRVEEQRPVERVRAGIAVAPPQDPSGPRQRTARIDDHGRLLLDRHPTPMKRLPRKSPNSRPHSNPNQDPADASRSLADLDWHTSARNMLAAHSMLWLVGKPGTGKTTFARAFALAHSGRPACELQGDPKADATAFWGRYTLVGGDMQFVDGPLTRALRLGSVFVLNDVGVVPFAALSTILPLREPDVIENPITHEVLQVPPSFRAILTSNPDNYKCRSNRSTLEALVDGCLVVEVPDLGDQGVRQLLAKNFPDAAASQLDAVTEAWSQHAVPKARQGEDAPMRLSYRAAHHLMKLLLAGVPLRDAMGPALIDKFFLDQDLHETVRLRHAMRDDVEGDTFDGEGGGGEGHDDDRRERFDGEAGEGEA